MSRTKIAPGNDIWYKILFENNPLPMFIYDAKTYAFLSVNQSALRHYGYSPDEWLRMSVWDLHLPEDLPRALRELQSNSDGSFHRAGTWRHLRKDRTQIDVDILRYPITFHGCDAALVMLHDVTVQHSIERALGRAERIARLGCWTWDIARNETWWSDQFYRNFGLEPRSIAASYEAVQKFVHPDDRETVDELIQCSLSTCQPFDSSHRVVWLDGSIHVMHAQGQVTPGLDGKAAQLTGTLLDITEQRRIENQLRDAQGELAKAQQLAHVGSWTWDVTKDLYYISSDESLRIYGFKREDFPAPTSAVFQVFHPDDRERILETRNRAVADPNAHYDVRYRIVHKDGSVRRVHSMADVDYDADGRPVRMVGTAQDITEKARAEERIKRLAYYDEVTGLPNRTLLRQEFDKTLEACGCTHRPIALLVINLVRLREINYTLGHANGDSLLKEVGTRIRNTLDKAQTVARTGNVQFSIILPDASVYGAVSGARQILHALEAPFPIAGMAYELGAHIGISLFPDHGMDAETLMRKADVALYQAKQSGQSYVVYQASHDPYNPQRLTLLGEFRKAINAGQLQLYCQPKASVQSGGIVGAEALVRWQHPVYGLIAPDQFIPLIEPTDLIHHLTKFMLKEAIRECHDWHRRGIRMPLAVNVSPRNLTEPEFPDHLDHLLHTWNAAPDWLGLEITESSLMKDPAASIAELDRLSKMGFRLFVDDFGTGYSSLSYLMKLPVNAIKIDHSFTGRMVEDKGAGAIVKSTIELAHNLGMSVVAEGTASQEIWNALLELGCDEAQGYFICPPIPAKDFMEWLQTSGYEGSHRPAPPAYPASATQSPH